MLLVTTVRGPATAEAGSVARYEATAFNRPHPGPEALAAINWEVRADGMAITRATGAGARLDLEITPEHAGRVLRVMPFAQSPTERVSVTTRITGTGTPTRETGNGGKITLRRDGRELYAQMDGGPEYHVGTEVSYGARRGLMNTRPGAHVYLPEDWRGRFGIWADIIAPTALCESKGHFHCLNTYDSAAFTFGFMQQAAHHPERNFVLLLRRLLLLPDASFYFPDLTLHEGHVAQRATGLLPGRAAGQDTDIPVILETGTSSRALMAYLNPDPDRVGTQEAEVAARFVHWAENSPANRAAQVSFTIGQQREGLAAHARRYDLDGMEDSICIAVADILHQGRGRSREIEQALTAADPLHALLGIGADRFPERCRTLAAGIARMKGEGIFGRHSYSLVNRDFVPD